MLPKKPLNDAQLEAFENSLDFDALLLKSADEMAARKTIMIYGPAIEANSLKKAPRSSTASK